MTISEELLADLIKKALSNGGEYADIFVERRKTSTVLLEDNKIEKVIAGSEAGVGIRLVFDGKTYYAFGNDFSPVVLTELAFAVARAADRPGSATVINLKKMRPEVSPVILRHPGDTTLSFKVDLVRKANEAARKLGSGIAQATVSYRDSVQQVTIVTSTGSLTEEERVYCTGTVQVIASEADVIQTGYDSVGGAVGLEIFRETPLEQVAETAGRRALMMLKARKAPGGRMPVIISSEAGGTMIHEAIGHGLEADLAQRGLSVFTGKVGQKVASELITVIDDATLPNKRGSFSFDDEGAPAQKTVLVQNGVLKGYIYDRYTANLDNTSPTGNGRRESYEYKPIPRMTNTYIAPGVSDPDQVIRSVSKGLLVTKMGGGQVNTVTGDFVFEVQEGYLIENGQKGEPVRGATLVGNGPEVLNAIDLVANDLGYSIGTCGKDGQGVPVSDAMPTLRIPEIVVGGETR